jgi:homoserine O-succinyltransferase
MQVSLNIGPSAHEPFTRPRSDCLDIALINNMPDSALQATERQFMALLVAAALPEMTVRLTPYALPEVSRGHAGRCHIASYSSINNLWNSAPDGLIVTGMEPCAVNLIEEPYWHSLTRLIDWAEENTASSIWSCLAAHAAAFHIDRIGRVRFETKRSGIFACARACDHQFTAGLPNYFQMPHSRWNDLPEEALAASGYRVLSRSAAGADVFVKQRKSLFIFFQGHPEYEPDTLLLEYRRDVKRFLRGESNSYPTMPQNYFDDRSAAAWNSLHERAMSGRATDEDLNAGFPSTPEANLLTSNWRSDAIRLYRNWLTYILGRKQFALKQEPAGLRSVRVAGR